MMWVSSILALLLATDMNGFADAAHGVAAASAWPFEPTPAPSPAREEALLAEIPTHKARHRQEKTARRSRFVVDSRAGSSLLEEEDVPIQKRHRKSVREDEQSASPLPDGKEEARHHKPSREELEVPSSFIEEAEREEVELPSPFIEEEERPSHRGHKRQEEEPGSLTELEPRHRSHAREEEHDLEDKHRHHRRLRDEEDFGSSLAEVEERPSHHWHPKEEEESSSFLAEEEEQPKHHRRVKQEEESEGSSGKEDYTPRHHWHMREEDDQAEAPRRNRRARNEEDASSSLAEEPRHHRRIGEEEDEDEASSSLHEDRPRHRRVEEEDEEQDEEPRQPRLMREEEPRSWTTEEEQQPRHPRRGIPDADGTSNSLAEAAEDSDLRQGKHLLDPLEAHLAVQNLHKRGGVSGGEMSRHAKTVHPGGNLSESLMLCFGDPAFRMGFWLIAIVLAVLMCCPTFAEIMK